MEPFSGYLISLEGGGTRSQAVLMDHAGRVLQSSLSSDVNTNFVPFEQAQWAVLNAVGGVLKAAGISGDQVNLCVSALVGPRFGEETYGTLMPLTNYLYYNECDVVFARAGIYVPHGVAVVAATGATAWGVRQDTGQLSFYGGWGSLLGDEGSGYALGLLGLRAAVRVFEGRASAPTHLLDATHQHFNLASSFREDLIHLAYQKPLSRAEIAGFATVVTRLAGQGDPLALQITRKVANDLAALALHAVRQLFTPEEGLDVVVAGGLVNAGELLLAPLQEALAQEFPRAVFHLGQEEPAVALGRLAFFEISNH